MAGGLGSLRDAAMGSPKGTPGPSLLRIPDAASAAVFRTSEKTSPDRYSAGHRSYCLTGCSSRLDERATAEACSRVAQRAAARIVSDAEAHQSASPRRGQAFTSYTYDPATYEPPTLIASPRKEPSYSYAGSPRGRAALAMHGSPLSMHGSPLSPVGGVYASEAPRVAAGAVPMPSMPARMAFQSWWTEGGAKGGERVHVGLSFDTASREFTVRIEGRGPPMVVAGAGRSGAPVAPCDLHIGAVVDVLGRKLTLRQVDGATMAWIDASARALIRERRELEDELSKFCIVALTHTSIAKSTSAEYHLKKHNAHEPLGGRSNLRGMMRDIRNLKAQLAKYRPDAEEDGLDGAWGDAE